jgi:hypothetical protein
VDAAGGAGCKRADLTELRRRSIADGQVRRSRYIDAMDAVFAKTWTTDRFLAWDNNQEGKHEFDGLPGPNITLSMQDHYRGLTFPA